MAKIKVKVDFKQLLEDITYTNKVTKNFDVSDIITRNQYYELKDSIITWLLTHKFTNNHVDWLEYIVDKNGQPIELVALTLTYGDTICQVHQKLKSKLRKTLNIDPEEKPTKEYVFNGQDDVEFDETRLRESLSRMKVNRLRFMRDRSESNEFFNTLAMNSRSNNPWMKAYIKLLPFNGRAKITIIS